MSAPDQEHVDAVARTLEGREVFVGFRDEAGDDACASGTIDFSDLRDLAKVILTDPTLTPALLDALTRHGVLTEEQAPGLLALDGFAPGDGPARRLVTRWDVAP